ncbi:MAG: hypothetical protein K8F91_04520, partial [Candidatus Obscuribacterales bacterium]|nr:hypothetical protein [Candidatus Obscuribacterales bacterium]
MNRATLSPEIVRMAQVRARENGLNLHNELARLAVENMVMNLDPELGLLLHEDESLSAIDTLAAAISANDIVINGHRIDVRAIDSEGNVSLPKCLVGSPLLSAGSLVVKIDGVDSFAVVAHISPGSWLNKEAEADSDIVVLTVEENADFDLESTLKNIDKKIQIPLDKAVNILPDEKELKKFVNNRSQIVVSRQKQIITALCARQDIREIVATIKVDLSACDLTRVLQAGAAWNRRTEEMAVVLTPKFRSLTQEEVKKELVTLGETYGGQPEAPEFRKAAIKKLTRNQLDKLATGASSTKVKAITEQVMAGKSIVEAVKSLVKNSVAVDIANAIQSTRGEVEGFVAATAEEIGHAFKQLALQPAYATHSSSKDTGTESINEALELIAACQLLEQME